MPPTRPSNPDALPPQVSSSADLESAGLAELIHSLPDAVLCMDREWRITFANKEAMRVSQITPENLNRETHWELYPDTLGTPVEPLYRGVMETRVPDRLEYHYERFDLWFDIQVIPIQDGIALCYRDITDLRRAQALRDTAAQQLQQVFDASIDSIVCLDKDWRFTHVNRIAQVLLQDDHLVGLDLWERFPGNHDEPFASSYRTTMRDRIPTDFEAFYAGPLNLWLRISARPFEDGIIIFFSDITDRKVAEAARDASVRELQQVFEATTDGIVSLASDWTITFLNDQAAAVLGRKDLLGRNLWEEFPLAVGDSEFYLRYHETMEHRTPGQFEAFYPAPLNVWFAIQCRPSDDGIVVFFRDITAEREARESLLREEETLTFVQQTARVATWEMDLATGAMTYSKGSFPVYGRPFSELNTMAELESFVDRDDLKRIRSERPTTIPRNKTQFMEYRVTGADGAILWIETLSVPVFANEGQPGDTEDEPIRFRGMSTDITARKENEEKLRTSEARYRVLADLNPQAIWMGAPNGAVIYSNQGFFDYSGLTMDDLAGGGWLEVFDPADQPYVVNAWTHSINTGENYEIEARIIRHSDGASRWWALRGLPVRDKTGGIQQWLGVAYDIHDIKTSAEELRQKQIETERQRAELETVYRTAPIGLALFDPVEFRYLRLNDRQAEIVGHPPEEVIGRVLTDVAPIPGLIEMFQQVAAGNPIQDSMIEGELPSRPGEHRYWNVNYYPVYAPDGSVQAITAASLEITHQKKSEAALIQSEKLAAVGRLASSISHEINNPLEAITNLLFLVAMDEQLSEATKLYVHMAQSELTRVSQIVTQTLRFHRQAVKPTVVTPGELVGAVLNLYQGRLANSGIKVESKYVSTTRIQCFENDIRQVLNNLIANAIDAMRGGGRLMVRSHDTTRYEVDPATGKTVARRGIRITIADTGHGMPAHVQKRIFEPFYTTKDLNGTGLGLWISSGIVAHHKGSLTVRSTQHPTLHGTIFSLFLPISVE